MAESHKYKDLAGLTAVFPEVPWTANAAGEVWVYNEKDDAATKVEKGQFVVKVADRYEVHDEEPAKAKTAEPKEEPEVQPDSQTVNPEKIGTKEKDGK